jgi:hypothetical protein
MVDADLDALSSEPVGDGKRILQNRFGEWHQWDKSVSHHLVTASDGLD